jgi:hypothetical protein
VNSLINRSASPIGFYQRSLEFTDKETKLALLALDPAASEGEIQNCSIALIRSLRRRYRDGHALLRDIAQQSASPPAAVTVHNPYANVRMPFGKHRGKRLRDISADYLLWTLANCHNLDPHLRTAIKRYLG